MSESSLNSIKRRIMQIGLVLIILVLSVMAFCTESNASEKYGEFYEIEDVFVINVLPETTYSDFKNNMENKNLIIKDKGIELEKDKYVGSGMTLTDGGKIYTISVISDLDGNGRLTILDLIKMRLYTAELINLDDKFKKSADINHDGKISISDLIQVNLIVSKIKDKIAPESFVPTIIQTKNTITVSGNTVDTFGSEVEYYFKLDDGEWIQNEQKTNGTYTFEGVDTNNSHTIRMKAIDANGNAKKSEAVITERKTGNIEIVPNITKWTNKDIIVSVLFDENLEAEKKLVSTDGGETFVNYEAPLVITQNTVIVAQIKNKYDELIEEKRLEISNIDKILPESFVPVIIQGRNSITVSALTQDKQSGIKEYEYLMINGLWKWKQTTADISCTFNGLISQTPYTLIVTAIDNAGNRREKTIENVYTNSEYTLTINVGNGVYNGQTSIQGETGSTVNLSTPTRQEYNFLGWEIQGAGAVNNNRFVFGEGDATLVAIWEPISYEITYDLNGGEETSNPTEYNVESEIINLNQPFKIGYEFLGWTGSNGTTPQIDVTIETGSTGNKSYVANWYEHSVFVSLYDTDNDNVGDCLAFSNNNESVLNYGSLMQRYNTDINKAHYVDATQVAWHNQRKNIKTVEIIDEIHPSSMAFWFYECENLTQINNLNIVNTKDVIYMVETFSSCFSLTSIDLSNFDTRNVIQMDAMFFACTSLTSIDVSTFDTSKVISMYGMFYKCQVLKSLDVSNFDTSKVTNMMGMFLWCWELENIDVSSFNTSNVTNMKYMFSWCEKLEAIDVSSFDTSSVTDMSEMFSYCMELKGLDLSNFNTSNVTTMENMFQGCYEIENLDLTSFDTRNVTNMKWMFAICHKLTSVTVSREKWITSQVDTSEMFSYSPIDHVTYV